MRYTKPLEVKLLDEGRPLLTTLQGGKVAVDPALVSLWEYAQGRRLEEIVENFDLEGATESAIQAGLACLSEAGLLNREYRAQPRAVEVVTGSLVSAVIVTYNSLEWLRESLPSLFAQSYTPLEIVIVDNGSNDKSSEWVASNYPQVVTLRLDSSQNFASAINKGVEIAQGEYFFLLNPDVRLEADAIAQMVAVAETGSNCAAVGAKLRFLWAPAFLNGLGNRVGSFSWGMDNGLGHLDLGQFDNWRHLPSVCFAAALIPRKAWEQIGPADEGFPMYYEDGEWSYRARLSGYEIRAAPQAVIYHAFGGRVPTGEDSGLSPRKLRNVVYGRFRFALKLVGDYLGQFLRNYVLEDWTNFYLALIQRDWPSAKAYLGGWFDILLDLPGLLKIRKNLQSRRVTSDDVLFGLQRDMPITLAWHGLPELTWDIVQHHYLPLFRSGRTRSMPEFEQSKIRPRLLIVSHDVVDVKMAGPGMRYLEMARALSDEVDVTLAVPSETSLEIPEIHLVRYWQDRPRSLEVLVENNDVVLASGYMVEKFPFLAYTKARVVIDLYDPFVLENLHYYLHEPLENQEKLNQHAVAITNRLAQIGDFFICGNDRQRDYWLGVLTANERANPRNFMQDPTLLSLIAVVGVGFPDREPQHHPFLRGLDPRVPEDCRIVLWGGGIWNWLDPLTLIRAWPEVVAAHPKARLVFLGTRHPNPQVPRHEMAEKSEKLAEEIDEKDSSILFFEWLSYADRESLLCESDVGVTLHPIQVETRFSIRTRILDYFWARLPVLITDGDVTSEWVKKYGLGEVVPESDQTAVAEGLIALLNKPKESWVNAFAPLRETHQWKTVVKPLLNYCLEGTYAPDRRDRSEMAPEVIGNGPVDRLARARHIWRTEGTGVLLHRIWRYIQWRLSRP